MNHRVGQASHELFEKLKRDRDRQSYERLVQTHRALVASVCRRFLRDPDDVDDVVQETFLKLGQHIGQLTGSLRCGCRRRRSRPASISSIDFIRRAIRKRNRQRGFAQVGGSGRRVQELATREAIRLRLHDAMLAVEPAARQVLAERFMSRTPLRVPAGRLNVSVPTASRRVTAALRQLAHVLRDMGVPAAHERDLADQFRDADAAALNPDDVHDHGGLRFAPDWRTAALTPFGAAAATTTPLCGFARPIRVGAMLSYESCRALVAAVPRITRRLARR
jgi:RNA polymerase sigma factor (sigma-70 family)